MKKQLQHIQTEGFETEVYEIERHLTNLNSHGRVQQLLNILKTKIQDYHIEYDTIQQELSELPFDCIDKEKRDEIQKLCSSPKTIFQARKKIRNYNNFIKRRNRICFPKELTQYTDEFLIGTGGFSRVYKVNNIKKNRIVAVKIPLKNDASIGKSFLRELNNWVRLDHSNIVKIYQYNVFPILYIEMEYCDTCLDDLEKPLQFNLALHYIRGIAEGLHYAHQHNIAHLDLKPQNILLKNDIPKITDWGLSRVLTVQGTTTLGISFPYAAPEQFSTRFGRKDAKTDIWQIGILLYFLLNNAVPFDGKDFAEYGKNVTTQNIKKIIKEDESNQDVSHILQKCLAREKKNRYRHLGKFIKDISDLM